MFRLLAGVFSVNVLLLSDENCAGKITDHWPFSGPFWAFSGAAFTAFFCVLGAVFGAFRCVFASFAAFRPFLEPFFSLFYLSLYLQKSHLFNLQLIVSLLVILENICNRAKAPFSLNPNFI